MSSMTIDEWMKVTEQTMRKWADAARTYRILTEEEYYEASREYETWLAEQHQKGDE